MNIKQQLRRLNLFGFSACLRISDAVWVALLVARGFSLWQIGVAEGIFHIVSLLCEIPSGVAADMIGRRRCLAAAGICGAASALLMALSSGFGGVCLAMGFSALACNFISGSDEALLYDSLLQCGRQDMYLACSAGYTQMQNLGSLLSNMASLLTGVMGHMGFYLADAAVCFVRTGSALALKEPVVTSQQRARLEHPFRTAGKRFREHMREVRGFLKNAPGVMTMMLADGVIGLPGYLTLMFLQQRLSQLGLPSMWLGLPVLGISLSRMAGVALGQRLRPRQLRTLYAVCALLAGFGTVLAGAAPMFPAVLGAMAAAASADAWVLHLQKRLNDVFPSDRRATLVSVNMMAYSLLMILVSPLSGWLGDISGTAGAGLCALGTVVSLAGIASLGVRHR